MYRLHAISRLINCTCGCLSIAALCFLAAIIATAIAVAKTSTTHHIGGPTPCYFLAPSAPGSCSPHFK